LQVECLETRDVPTFFTTAALSPTVLFNTGTPSPAFNIPVTQQPYVNLGSYVDSPYIIDNNGVLDCYSPASGEHFVYGAIRDKYLAIGSVNSPLGYPISEEQDVPGVPGARVSHFQGGDIYWSPDPNIGAHEVHGAIRDEYNAKGGPAGFLGLPLTDETGTPDGIGRYNHFQYGSIYWTPNTGAHSVDGLIRDKWASLGWEQSLLGYPISDEYGNSDGFAVSNFQNGSIVFRSDVGTHLSFSRNELLNAINDAIQISQGEGGMDANAFYFLQQCADDPNVYMTWANHNLLHKMIDGNVANAHYLGSPLGNLSPGDPTWKIYDLEQKWFEGADVPYASDTNNNVYGYAQADGVLFNGGVPSWADVKQGGSNDCYFMAALEAVAIKHPDIIQNMITDNGDGTYTVRFFQSGNNTPGVADYVTVNGLLPVDQYGRLVFAGKGRYASLDPVTASYSPLWADLIEKAYAQVNEENWTAHDGTNSYNGIPGTNTGGINFGYAADALNQITNWNSSVYWQGAWPWSGGNFADDTGNAFRLGLTVTVGTQTSVSDGDLIPKHEYVLISVSPDNQVFVVANPLGHDANGGFAMTTLSRDQFINNFSEFSDA
jgi:hypothetical protein